MRNFLYCNRRQHHRHSILCIRCPYWKVCEDQEEYELEAARQRVIAMEGGRQKRFLPTRLLYDNEGTQDQEGSKNGKD